jgi:phytoene/squalene synthetase
MADEIPNEMSDALRSHDRNRYLATLFAPDDKRAALTALYAFHVELGRIRSLVSDPQIGLIRLQWWRDTIESVYQGEDPDHPLAKILAPAIREHKLPEAALLAMITAHEFDLYADQMPSIAALETYLGETEGATTQLACLILDPSQAGKAANASGFVSVANGIVRLVQALPQLVPRGSSAPEIVDHAEKRWREFQNQSLPKTLRPAFLHAADTSRRIKSARKLKQAAPWLSQWDIWRASKLP